MCLGPKNDGAKMCLGPKRGGAKMCLGPKKDGAKMCLGPKKDGAKMCLGPKMDGAKMCLGPKRDGAKMCPGPKRYGAKMCLGPKVAWGQSVFCFYGAKMSWGQSVSGAKMFGPKGVRAKLAGPNWEAAVFPLYVSRCRWSSFQSARKLATPIFMFGILDFLLIAMRVFGALTILLSCMYLLESGHLKSSKSRRLRLILCYRVSNCKKNVYCGATALW